MKRYWKILSLSLVTLLSIGMFYIQDALAESPYPEITIETISGNEEIVSGLVLEGDMHQSDRFLGFVKITPEGSNFAKEFSFTEQIAGNVYLNSTIQEYQDEYRSFMRGKTASPSNYFENLMLLAYVDSPSHYSLSGRGNRPLTLEVEMLEKETEEVTEWSIDVPNSERYYSLYIEDVQVVNNQMKVLTRNFLKSDGWSSDELHLYQLDLVNGTIVGDHIVGEDLELEEGQFLSVEYLNHAEDVGAEEYLVFNVGYRQELNEESVEFHPDFYPEISKQELLSYNLATGEEATIELSAEKQTADIYSGFVEQEVLYLPQYEGSQLDILSFNLERNEWAETLSLDVNSGDQEAGSTLVLEDSRLYVIDTVHETSSPARVQVVDIANNQVLYEGEIHEQQANETEPESSIYLWEATVK